MQGTLFFATTPRASTTWLAAFSKPWLGERLHSTLCTCYPLLLHDWVQREGSGATGGPADVIIHDFPSLLRSPDLRVAEQPSRLWCTRPQCMRQICGHQGKCPYQETFSWYRKYSWYSQEIWFPPQLEPLHPRQSPGVSLTRSLGQRPRRLLKPGHLELFLVFPWFPLSTAAWAPAPPAVTWGQWLNH